MNLGAVLAEVNHVARTRFPLFMLGYKVFGNMVAFLMIQNIVFKVGQHIVQVIQWHELPTSIQVYLLSMICSTLTALALFFTLAGQM